MAAMASSFVQMPKLSTSITAPRHAQQVPSPLNSRNAAPPIECIPGRSADHSIKLDHQNSDTSSSLSRRQALVASTGILSASVGLLASSPAALADFLDDYKSDTEAVIAQVKDTLALEKTDPAKPDAVATLRQSSNSWVAKYRREKSVAGKPSFSNMYSVLNAISGHYISFGPSSTIPAKRQQRILEEVKDAEKALSRGR